MNTRIIILTERGTQFVIPSLSRRGVSDLTPGAEAGIRKVASYPSRQVVRRTISQAAYDIGFDAPETPAIRRDQTMYYAFFAKQYVKGKSLATVSKHRAHLQVEFGDLLMEVHPQ